MEFDEEPDIPDEKSIPFSARAAYNRETDNDLKANAVMRYSDQLFNKNSMTNKNNYASVLVTSNDKQSLNGAVSLKNNAVSP